MRRTTWIWLGIGSVGALLLAERNRNASGPSVALGLPVETSAPPQVTPRGYFGAARAGPPKHLHQGVDLAAVPGSYVLAVGNGTIVHSRPGLGKTVRKLKLDARGNWSVGRRFVDAIVYADLGTPLAQPGQRVRQGDPIALVDRTGFVHFAVKEIQPGGEVFFDPKEAGFVYRPSVFSST
jgi:murein DD-endopeptidase MepM/ murein hydrolase activator NlpD